MDGGYFYHYYYGTTDGGYTHHSNTMGGKSYCSKMSQVDSVHYNAICASNTPGNSWYEGSCPKGWGRNKGRYPRDSYSVYYAQGYIANSNPIYSTVTKYRTAYHNYITTRVAKA